MNREELEAELAVLDLSDKLDALKTKVRDGDRSDETLAAFKAAKVELYEARQVLRAGRTAPAPEDGYAEPELVTTKTKGG